MPRSSFPLLCALLIALFSGCATTPETQATFSELPARAGLARMYVYREKKLPGFAAKPSLKVDGREVAMLRNGTYLAFYLPTGTHEIAADFSLLYAPIKSSKATVTVEADRELYLRFNIQMTGFAATTHLVYSEWATGFDIPDESVSKALVVPLEPGNSDFDLFAK